MSYLEKTVILIIEDSLSFQNLLKEFLKNIGVKDIVIAADYKTAIHLFDTCNPDMALIDIDLGNGKTGIDVAHTFNSYRKIPFVFITSLYYDEEYERAKETGPIAFINKEISELGLRQVVELAFRQQRPVVEEGYRKEENDLLSDEIFIRIGNVLKKIPLKEVDWFGIDGKHAFLKKENKKLPLNIYLKELEEILPTDQFIRIHQSYIINIKKIESINTIKGIVTIQKEDLPIGRSYKKNFFKRIKYF